MGFTRELNPWYWIMWCLIALFGTLVSAGILRTERQKRKAESSTITSDYLRITSEICFVLGPMSTVLLLLNVVPGFCFLQYTGSVIVFGTQYIIMGFYQLSRLHYCFSNEQVHHQRGYPLWIFVVMVSIGILILLSWIALYLLVDTFPKKCGFRRGGTLFWEYRDRTILWDGDSYRDDDILRIYYFWHSAVCIAFQIWDITTLIMYCWKIWKIGKIYKSNRESNRGSNVSSASSQSQRDSVWNNILIILYRVVIVTAIYQIFSLFATVIFIGIYAFSWPDYMKNAVHLFRAVMMPTFYSVLIPFCMYLMMEHNTTEYHRFLRFLKRFYLNYCCFCCCYYIVEDQLTALELSKCRCCQSSDITLAPSPVSKKVRKITKLSTLRTNASAHFQYQVDSAEFSLETITRVGTGDL